MAYGNQQTINSQSYGFLGTVILLFLSFFFATSPTRSLVGWFVCLLCMGEWVVRRKFKFQAFISVQYSSFVYFFCCCCCCCSTTTDQWSCSRSSFFFLVGWIPFVTTSGCVDEYEWQMWISLFVVVGCCWWWWWSLSSSSLASFGRLTFVDAADVSWCCHVIICKNVQSSTGWMPGLAGTAIKEWRQEFPCKCVIHFREVISWTL